MIEDPSSSPSSPSGPKEPRPCFPWLAVLGCLDCLLSKVGISSHGAVAVANLSGPGCGHLGRLACGCLVSGLPAAVGKIQMSSAHLRSKKDSSWNTEVTYLPT